MCINPSWRVSLHLLTHFQLSVGSCVWIHQLPILIMFIVRYSINSIIPPNGSLHHISIFVDYWRNYMRISLAWKQEHLEDIYLASCIMRSCSCSQHDLLSGAKHILKRTGSNSCMAMVASSGSACLNSRSVLFASLALAITMTGMILCDKHMETTLRANVTALFLLMLNHMMTMLDSSIFVYASIPFISR